MSSSYTDANELSGTELEKFLKGHHHAAKDTRSNEVVHVYAIAGHPVFGEERSSYDFDIEFGFAGLTWFVSLQYEYLFV